MPLPSSFDAQGACVAFGRSLCHAQWRHPEQNNVRPFPIPATESQLLGRFLHHYLTMALLIDRTPMVLTLAESLALEKPDDLPDALDAESEVVMICALASLAWVHQSVRQLVNLNYPQAGSSPRSFLASSATIWALDVSFHLFSQHIVPRYLIDQSTPYPLSDSTMLKKFTSLRPRIEKWAWINPWPDGLPNLQFRFTHAKT